jgi:hypothetical protein
MVFELKIQSEDLPLPREVFWEIRNTQEYYACECAGLNFKSKESWINRDGDLQIRSKPDISWVPQFLLAFVCCRFG